MRLTVGCHKGGVAKTTTAVLLALELAREGPTVLVDGDPQRSASTWETLARQRAEEDSAALPWPDTLTVVPWRDPITVPPLDHVVIDTPPGDPERLRAALRVSDTALVPIGSRRGDVVQLGATVRVLQEIEQQQPLSWGVLLTLVRLRTRAAAEAPAAIESDGLPLLMSVIPQSESIAAMFGTVPAHLPGSYRQVLEEITEEPAHVG